MPVTDLGSDWNSAFRLPQGWTPYPDGSVGPSSGLPDWLRQLIPNPGAATPNAPGLPGGGVGPGGAYMPGGGVMGRQAATPGAPSMGFPAQGGPPTFQAGQPMGPDVTGGGGNPLAFLGGNINPYARAAIAGAGVMAPTPTAANDQAPTNAWFQRPSGVGGMPGPQVTNTPPGPAPAGVGGPYVGGQGTPQTYPHMPWPDTGAAPQGTPSDTPRPGDPPLPPKRPKNLGMGQSPTASVPPTSTGNPRFGLYQPQVPGSGQGGPLSRSPIYTTLNLFGGGGPSQAAPAPGRATIPANATASVPDVQSQAPSNYGPLQQGNNIWDALTGKAPWNYGPLQKGNIWKGSGGPPARKPFLGYTE